MDYNQCSFYIVKFSPLIVLIILIYAFVQNEKKEHFNKPKQNKVQQTPEDSVNFADIEFKDFQVINPNNPNWNPIEKFTNQTMGELSKTDLGKGYLEKQFIDEIRKKYGNEELFIIFARNSGTVRASEFLKGAGKNIVCGDTAKVKYTYSISKGKDSKHQAPEKGEQISTITLGKGGIIKGLDQAISGMKKGAVRKIAIPRKLLIEEPEFSELAKNNPDLIVYYEVELLEIIHHIPYTEKNYKIISQTELRGKEAEDAKTSRCGQNVTISYVIKDNDKIEKQAGELTFTLGSGEVPIGLEQTSIHMFEGSSRRIFIPKELMKTASGKNISEFKTPKDTNLEIKLESVNFD